MPYNKKRKQKIVYQIARTRSELEQAFSLVYKEYKLRGYIPKRYKSKLRLSLYNALPSTAIFLAKQGREVLATVTFITDSPLGLPMDKIYKDRVNLLRKKGRRIAECSQLSINHRLFPEGWFSMFNFEKLIFLFRLFKLVLDYAIYVERIDDFCIAVNPKHQYLYKFINFEKIGGLKYYGSVNKAPAIALHLDLHTLEGRMRNRKAVHKIFFGSKTNLNIFKKKYTITIQDLEYFFLEKSDLLKKATGRQLKYIKGCYPKGAVEAILKKYE
jgi:hypothetical protein